MTEHHQRNLKCQECKRDSFQVIRSAFWCTQVSAEKLTGEGVQDKANTDDTKQRCNLTSEDVFQPTYTCSSDVYVCNYSALNHSDSDISRKPKCTVAYVRVCTVHC